MTTIIETIDGIVPEIAETDTLKESDLLTGGDAEVETEIIETGETTLMIGLEGAVRTLLTLGPAAEVTEIPRNQQAGLRV
jgi:hypothetical protein